MGSTISSTTPSTAQNRLCWECSLPVAPLQATRALHDWQAIICVHCEPWVAALLGPLPAGDADRECIG